MKKIYQIWIISVSLSLIFSLFFFSSNSIFARDSEEGELEDDYVVGEVIVKYKGDREPFRVVKIPQGKSVREAEEEFEARADVEYAEPNYIAYAFLVPNDPYYGLQWHLDNPVYGGIKAETAWNTSSGLGVTVAVIDTGIAYENYRNPVNGKRYYKAPDLNATCFVSGYDYVEKDNHPNDDNSHGTHVAGTVAQSTNNSIGVAGVAFSSCLMPVKVLDRNGSGTYANVAAGIRFAADNGAKVINLSLGGSASSQTLLDAVAYAYNKGAVIVAAAGNDGTNIIAYPAAYDNYVIAVGATRYDETLSYYSNFGLSLDLVAPGGDLTVDQNRDGYGDGVLQNTFNPNTKNTSIFGYWFFQGTSMAVPHVSGVAALVISKGNATTPNDIRKALESTADDLGVAGRDDTYGYGIVNAAAALAWTAGPIDNPPTVSIASPANGAVVSGLINITANAADDIGVARVDFYVGSVLLGSDTAAPYGVSWDSTTVLDGAYIIKATAIDTASQSSSASINVTVDNVNDSPIANAGADKTVSDANGSGFETVTLVGSGTDPDGQVIAYEWKEGSLILGTFSTLTGDFAVGIHTLVLTVTDNKGATGQDSAVVTVLANQAPLANAGPDKSATVNSSIAFNGSASFDPDGTITSYLWNFGDGTTGIGATPTHIYSLVGTYIVTLTVTDSGGLTSQDTAVVTVLSAPTLNIVIESIITKDTNPGGKYYVRMYVKNNETASYAVTGHIAIFDPAGNPVSWSGLNDKVVSISAISRKSITWEDVVPANALEGTYLAKVDALYQGVILSSAQKTFLVAGSVSSDRD